MQVLAAKDEGCGIVMELDANAKLGCDLIKGDPNRMSYNGQIMFEMIERQNLIIGNASIKCKGTITRHRSTVEKTELSVLDYLIFCEIMEPFFESMLVDENPQHVLKKYVTTKGVKQHTESEQRVTITRYMPDFQLKMKKRIQRF